jgi:hypothetical protein
VRPLSLASAEAPECQEVEGGTGTQVRRRRLLPRCSLMSLSPAAAPLAAPLSGPGNRIRATRRRRFSSLHGPHLTGADVHYFVVLNALRSHFEKVVHGIQERGVADVDCEGLGVVLQNRNRLVDEVRDPVEDLHTAIPRAASARALSPTPCHPRHQPCRRRAGAGALCLPSTRMRSTGRQRDARHSS